MASLKEVKNRINSVSSTRKITSAMKMVASSKLHRAQAAIRGMRPYERLLSGMMSRFLDTLQDDLTSPFAQKRVRQKVVIVAISSNSSLCGAFNSNIQKCVLRVIERLHSEKVQYIELMPIGVKISEKVKKLGYEFDPSLSGLLDKPSATRATQVAESLMTRFVAKEVDQVILIYNHFKSSSAQVVMTEDFLPVSLKKNEKTSGDTLGRQNYYLIEPSSAEVLESLIPQSLHLKIYAALLDSLASEHAARVIAMQVATDNADELLQELTLQYNKSRQAAITNELLDIAGASFS